MHNTAFNQTGDNAFSFLIPAPVAPLVKAIVGPKR
jgi:hypothetical protein